jgi:hypothetical protein
MVRAVEVAGFNVAVDIFVGFMVYDVVDHTKQRRGSDSPVSTGSGDLKNIFRNRFFVGEGWCNALIIFRLIGV